MLFPKNGKFGFLGIISAIILVLFLSVCAHAETHNSLKKVIVKDSGNATIIEIETETDIQDCRLLNKENHSTFQLFLTGLQIDSPLASIPTKSNYVARLILKRKKDGIILNGKLTREWSNYTLSKDANMIHIRLGFDFNQPDLNKPKAVSNLTPVTSVKNIAAQNIDEKALENLLRDFESMAPAEKTLMAEQPEGLYFGKKVYTGKPISLDLVDADLKNVLRLIADFTKMNIVIDPGIHGKVTLKVENVPWDQIFDMILKANGLGIEKQGNVIRVAKKGKLRKELEEQEKLLEKQRSLIEKQAELLRTRKNLGPVETAYLVVNYADLDTIKDQIDKTIKSDDGKIDVDPRTRTIIYTDYRPRIEDAKRLISRLDKPLLQVLLEARVVAVNSRFRRALGIRWGFAYENFGSTTFDPNNPGNSATSYSPNFAINTPVAANAGVLGFAWSLLKGRNLFSIDMELRAAEENGVGHIIAAPRVHTLNNQTATITQGIEIPYLELTETGVATTEFREAVLELNVTPYVTPDRRILLKLDVKQEEPDFSRAIQGQPPINKNEVKTQLLVEDDTIVVLGGVLKNRVDFTQEAVPGLSKLPLLGGLFKSKDKLHEKNELMIFIKPRIIELPQVQIAEQ